MQYTGCHEDVVDLAANDKEVSEVYTDDHKTIVTEDSGINNKDHDVTGKELMEASADDQETDVIETSGIIYENDKKVIDVIQNVNAVSEDINVSPVRPIEENNGNVILEEDDSSHRWADDNVDASDVLITVVSGEVESYQDAVNDIFVCELESHEKEVKEFENFSEMTLTCDTVSLAETPENEHVSGFYEVNPETDDKECLEIDSSVMTISAVTSETISPIETPENEHAKGFYEVNPEHSSADDIRQECRVISVGAEMTSSVETPEKETSTGFYEVNPVISVSASETKDVFDDNFESDLERAEIGVELQGTVLQNIDIGKISSPVESPNEENIAEGYKINPMIPEILIEEDPDSKLDVFDSEFTKDDKFIELTSSLVESVINGAIEVIVNMKQSHVVEKDSSASGNIDRKEINMEMENIINGHGESSLSEEPVEGSYISDTAKDGILKDTSNIISYPVDSDSDDSAGSSTTTEGSYRIMNSRDSSPLNTPENTSTLEDFISNQSDSNIPQTKDSESETKQLQQSSNVGERHGTKHVKQDFDSENNEICNVNEVVDSTSSNIVKSSDDTVNDGTKQVDEPKFMDIGDSIDVSESVSEDTDYMKQHKSEYTTRKQIFMTSAGRMSISIDSVADPPLSDPDQSATVMEHDTIHEETHAEVGYIIARARSIVGHADETLARLSDATIARLRDMATLEVSDVACLEELDVVCDYKFVLSEVLSYMYFVACFLEIVVHVLVYVPPSSLVTVKILKIVK